MNFKSQCAQAEVNYVFFAAPAAVPGCEVSDVVSGYMYVGLGLGLGLGFGWGCECMKQKRIAIENGNGVNRYCPLQLVAIPFYNGCQRLNVD